MGQARCLGAIPASCRPESRPWAGDGSRIRCRSTFLHDCSVAFEEGLVPSSTPEPWRPRVERWLAGHHGVISVAQAVDLGVPERVVRSAVGRGELIALHPGVYRSRAWPDGQLQQMTAALARSTVAVLAFITAARLWKARRLPRDE